MADVLNKQQILDEVHDEKNALGQEVDGLLVHWRDLRVELKRAIEADVDWAERLIRDRSGRIMQVIFPRQGEPVTDNPVNAEQPPANTTSTPKGSTPLSDGTEPQPGDPNAGYAANSPVGGLVTSAPVEPGSISDPDAVSEHQNQDAAPTDPNSPADDGQDKSQE